MEPAKESGRGKRFKKGFKKKQKKVKRRKSCMPSSKPAWSFISDSSN